MKEPPMSQVSKAGEIVRATMDLLHEGGVAENDPLPLQHAMHLLRAAVRIGDMFENRLRHHPIERLVIERDVVRIADDGDMRSERDVSGDELHAAERNGT